MEDNAEAGPEADPEDTAQDDQAEAPTNDGSGGR
jgi:hypothetical protein